MARKTVRQRGAQQRARQARRTRAAVPDDEVTAEHLPPLPPTDAGDRRRAATTCGWCGGPLQPKARGRIPKWCSPSCRQRAWEQARAAASGLSAVRVVERRVDVRAPASPARRDWVWLLHDLAGQLDDGRAYDRDLPDLSVALNAVRQAYGRRPYVRRQAGGLPS